MLEFLEIIYDVLMPDGIGPTLYLSFWVLNFLCSVAALFISLYLLITHDDLKHDQIQPLELCGHIKMVSYFPFNAVVFTD